MNCEEALELISAALDGELTSGERTALDGHLSSCPSCAALFEELSGQSRLLRELDCEVPDGLMERVLSQLPEQTPAPVKTGRVLHWRRWGALAACLVLAVWAGLSLPGQNGRPTAEADPITYDLQNSAPSGSMESAQAEFFNDLQKEKSFGQDRIADEGAPTASDIQYLRTTWTDSGEPLAAQYLSTYTDLTDFLAQYPQDDLSVVTQCYDEVYFANAALIAVPIEETSGSVTPTVAEVFTVENGYEVVIQQETPEAATDDMVSWLILIEIESTGEQQEAFVTLVAG